jgi:hypothetical protein
MACNLAGSIQEATDELGRQLGRSWDGRLMVSVTEATDVLAKNTVYLMEPEALLISLERGEHMENRKKDSSEQKKRSKRNRLNLRIDDEEFETLNLISYEDDENISQIVRKAIKQYAALRKSRKHF